eukprot:GHVN01009136.1.p1 GENE.GHVN01009136.1~~GHVN01009136.1.p1  ORF type:complete len:481 (+),score=74.44 GHVN01009136.1:423-1865(+)
MIFSSINRRLSSNHLTHVTTWYGSLKTRALNTIAAKSIKEYPTLTGIDHLEIYSSNARQSALWYCNTMGFSPFAYRGEETGSREKTSYALKQGDIRLVISSPTGMGLESTLVSEFVREHGDGVAVIAFKTPDASGARDIAVAKGALVTEPYETAEHQFAHRKKGAAGKMSEVSEVSDGDIVKEIDSKGNITDRTFIVYKGTVNITGIDSPIGKVQHYFIERDNYKGVFLPGFVPFNPTTWSFYSPFNKGLPSNRQLNRFTKHPVGLTHIDHLVANVPKGKMDEACKWYEDIMGFSSFQEFSSDEIKTGQTALSSRVMTNHDQSVKIPINEPASGRKQSQIQEFLDYNKGPGIQHIALSTPDISRAVTQLSKRGAQFLTCSPQYHKQMKKELVDANQPIPDSLETVGPTGKKRNGWLATKGILMDTDEKGHMFQIFTKPVSDRPTLFYEIIQREGSESFGKGNFKSLFRSMEKEQKLRGTL